MQPEDTPLDRHDFTPQSLLSEFPQTLPPSKQIVFNIACPSHAQYSGIITYSRWPHRPLPDAFTSGHKKTSIQLRDDYFGYEPATPCANVTEWYLNFAHFDLFGFYNSDLFAQDEMQVAEHPALGSLCECLRHSKRSTRLIQGDQPTPILIKGVERRCCVAIDSNPTQGRPWGLYGNEFARASLDAIQRATTALNPPTISNILAIVAPAHGSGTYTREQIENILLTAYSGFSAARIESLRSAQPDHHVAIHTGYWGCGAFGGNRLLMSLLQLIAAQLAQVDSFIFHAGPSPGRQAFTDALDFYETRIIPRLNNQPRSTLIDDITSLNCKWGLSDGN